MSIPTLLTFVFLLYRFQPRVGSINKAFHQLTFGISGVNNVMTLIRETESPSIRSGSKQPARLQHEIRFERLVFGYSGEAPVLKDVSFSLKSGETTAVVGSSGAGKTTVVNLVMRFYDPLSGSVLVDGTDLKELDLQAWRSSIALVNQDIFLFNDTVGSNIAMGKLGATDQEIAEAARRAYADEFISNLPQGYETVIGDRGVRLSGGQRQRIALARAIVRDPQILILDEATSELDSRSEQLIRQAVEELGASRTVITVAHRLSTIRHAEKIVVLDKGKVVEEGSHDDLLKGDGQYAQFLRVQELATADGS
jgi:subfamily B ATP-binding cassette protein MsbA